MRVKLFAVVLVLAFCTGLMADPVFDVLSGGSLTATIIDSIAPPNVFLGLDLRGSSNAAVFDTVFIGAANVNSLFPFPIPNTVLFAQNFAGTQFVTLTEGGFNLSGTELLVNELGTPLGTVTDPGLAAFEGALLFDFTYETTIVDTTDNVVASYFALTSITAVPEPSGFPVVLTGACMIVGYLGMKRRSTRTGKSLPQIFES